MRRLPPEPLQGRVRRSCVATSGPSTTPTSTTRYLARCRRRGMAASAWEVGAFPTRARTRRSTCTATPWDTVEPSTLSPLRRSKLGTLTTRSPGLMTATETHLSPPASSHPFGTLPLKPLLRGWAAPPGTVPPWPSLGDRQQPGPNAWVYLAHGN